MNPNLFEQKRHIANLRAEAEALLARAPAPDQPTRPAEELLHELRVHQIELEMQNEELRRAHAELEESRDRYLDLYAFAPVGYFTLTREGTVAESNLTGAMFLGVERKKLLDRRFDAYVVAEDRDRWHHQFLSMLKDEIGRRKFELRLKRSDGSVFYGRLDCLRVDGADAPPTIRITLGDIDDLKRAEEQLRQLNEALEQRVREEVAKSRDKDILLVQRSRLAAIAEVIHNVSHHWRQPLSAVGLVLANIKDAYEFGDLSLEYLEKEVACGQRLIHNMSATIDHFRGFFSSDDERQRFRICAAVDEAVELLDPVFKGSDVKIEVVRCRDEHSVVGRPGDFARVVLGVLTNASNAINKSNVAGKIRIKMEKVDQAVTVSFTDNGGGVPADVLNRIFDPYYTTQEGNIGLGLYLAKTIMDNMGGSIVLRNAGDGAEVLLTLPLEAPEQASSAGSA